MPRGHSERDEDETKVVSPPLRSGEHGQQGDKRERISLKDRITFETDGKSDALSI